MNNEGHLPDRDDLELEACIRRVLKAIKLIEKANGEVVGIGEQEGGEKTNKFIVEIMLTKGYGELTDTRSLPSPSEKAFEVYRAATDLQVSMDQLAAKVKGDQAISSRVVALANCSLYPRVTPATTIADATRYLGRDHVMKIALGVTVIDGTRNGSCENFNYMGFWSRCAALAATAEVLAMESKIKAGEAFLAGLFCQLGRLAFASAKPDEYSELIADVRITNQNLCRLEKARFGINHCELAGMMLADWKLPEWIHRAVRYQYSKYNDGFNAECAKEEKLNDILKCSTAMVGVMLCRKRNIGILNRTLQRAEAIGIRDDQFPRTFDEAVGSWQAVGDVLNVTTLDVPDWAHL